MSDDPSLLVDRDGPVVTLTMNRPERRNALIPDMLVRFADAWDMVDGDDSIRCVILTGAGDRGLLRGRGPLRRLDGRPRDRGGPARPAAARGRPGPHRQGPPAHPLVRTPIVAAVNGQCLGGGCEMLQQTDIRVAEEHATFGLPEVHRGLIAGAGSTMRLKRQIPYAVAMEMLLTGRILDAEEALRWGLVTHVVPKGEGLAKARELAEVMCAAGPLSVKASKASASRRGGCPSRRPSRSRSPTWSR